MKNSMLIIAIILFVSFSANTLALSTDLKQTYSPGESIIIKIIGKVTEPMTFDKIKFVKAGKVQEVPLEYGVSKIGDSNYIWAIAPKSQDNYSILINNVKSIEGGLPKEINFQQNFSVEGNLSSYAVRPGVIIADRNFSLKVISYEESDINISIDFPDSRNIKIEPGENNVVFSMDKFTAIENKIINVGKYALPAYLIGDLTKEQESSSLQIYPLKIQKELSAGKNSLISFTITNAGISELNKIEIDYPRDTFYLYPDENKSLKSGESSSYNLTLKKSDNISIREVIYARTGGLSVPLPISVDFTSTKENSDESVNATQESELYRCAELGGKICKGEEVCNGSKNSSLEGTCCIGICVVQDSGSSSSSQIFGYVLAVAVILGLGYLYWRYKKTRGESNVLPRKIKEAENLGSKP